MIETNSPAFWRATLALCLGSFLVFANVYLTQPLLPLFSETFSLTPLQSSWSLSLTTLALALSLLVYGPLSDAVGRQTIMTVTMILATLVTLLLAWVPDFESLLVLRILQGFLLGGLPAIAIAYMGEEFTKRAMLVAVGLYISGNTLGGISGRIIGGVVSDWADWRSAFLVMAVISLFCFAAYLWLLPSSQQFRPKKLRLRRVRNQLLGHLANPMLWPVYLIAGGNFAIFVGQYNYITFVLSASPYHLSSSMLGMLFLTYLSGTFASAISGRLIRRWPQALGMGVGIAIMVLGAVTTLIGGIEAIIVGLLISSFGFFFSHSLASSWVSRYARTAKASASSLYLFFYYLGASVGTLLLDPFWQWAAWPGVVSGVVGVLVLTSGCALLLYRRERGALAEMDALPHASPVEA